MLGKSARPCTYHLNFDEAKHVVLKEEHERTRVQLPPPPQSITLTQLIDETSIATFSLGDLGFCFLFVNTNQQSCAK